MAPSVVELQGRAAARGPGDGQVGVQIQRLCAVLESPDDAAQPEACEGPGGPGRLTTAVPAHGLIAVRNGAATATPTNLPANTFETNTWAKLLVHSLCERLVLWYEIRHRSCPKH